MTARKRSSDPLISAIGIGVMLFYQLLVAALDVGGGGIGVQAHRVEGLGLERLQLALPRERGPRPRARACSTKPKGSRMRACAPAADRRDCSGLFLRLLVDADRPGRAMAGDGLLLVARDLAVRKAGEIIVALVVFLDVLEAEHERTPFRHCGRPVRDATPFSSQPSHWHVGGACSASGSPCGGSECDRSILNQVSWRPNYGASASPTTRIDK